MEQTQQPITPLPKLFNDFLEKGKTGKNEFWRYLVGFAIVAAFYILGEFPFGIAAMDGAMKNGHSIIDIANHEEKLLDPSYTGMNPNTLLVLELFIFVSSMFGLWIVVRFLHKKPFTSIITSAQKIRWKRFGIAFLIWFLFGFAGQFVSMWMYPDAFKLVFDMKPFLITLLIGVLMLPIQTWFEEFFFRGYLLQGFGLIFKKAIFPVIITGCMFALVHMSNPEVKAYGVLTMLPAYLLPGIFFALFASLDEGLESVMGIHFANNLFGTIGVTSSASAIQASTIWSASKMFPSSDNLALLIQLLVMMFILMKINKWKFDKLYR